MAPITRIIALAATSAIAVDAFSVTSSMPRQTLALRMADGDDVNTAERGVSLDQDGKSNVWAIEPKMEVESKSSEEKTSSALFAVGGLAAFAAVAAGLLTNLPDPDQF